MKNNPLKEQKNLRKAWFNQLEDKIFLLLTPDSVKYYFTQTKHVLSQVR